MFIMINYIDHNCCFCAIMKKKYNDYITVTKMTRLRLKKYEIMLAAKFYNFFTEKKCKILTFRLGSYSST